MAKSFSCQTVDIATSGVRARRNHTVDFLPKTLSSSRTCLLSVVRRGDWFCVGRKNQTACSNPVGYTAYRIHELGVADDPLCDRSRIQFFGVAKACCPHTRLLLGDV